MSILSPIATQDFLRDHWQQRPLLVSGALSDTRRLVDGDELAGLACEDGVESRIVVHDADTDLWHCEHGPFDPGRFASLPATRWTLLVQSVEHWIPELQELLRRFDFLPRWRLDDVMASYASDGGGVGPHFDNYDVFLIQARGRRRWQLGQRCDDHTALRDHPSLRLLAQFRAEVSHELDEGDLLYLPPGVAHLGCALGDDCITLSVGFRAPSNREILQGMADSLGEDLGEQWRYRDTASSIDADPFLINPAALAQLRAVYEAVDEASIELALAQSFGRQVTEPRQPWLMDAPQDLDGAPPAPRPRGERPLRLRHNPASRFAYTLVQDRAVLFVDGESHLTTPALARAICHGEVHHHALGDAPGRELLQRLIRQGSLCQR